MTVEDPIEYELDGIGQTQVNPKIDLTFAKALRAILRQDPDVIMIGEIRDLETAQIAVQASLTGHLVLATLHTNDAPQRGDAADRHGRRAVPAVVAPARRAGAAPGAQAVPALPRGRRSRRPLAPGRLRPLRHDRLQGPHRRLRADDRRRRDPHAGHQGSNDTDMRRAAEKNGMINMRGDAQRWIKPASRRRKKHAARHART